MPSLIHLAWVATQPVLKTALLCGVGAWATRKGLLTTEGRRVLSAAAFFVFSPSLSFVNLTPMLSISRVVHWWPFIANALMSICLGLGVGYLILPLARPEPWFKNHVLVCTALGNSMSLPLVLVTSLTDSTSGLIHDMTQEEASVLAVAYISMGLVAATLLHTTMGFQMLKPSKSAFESPDDIKGVPLSQLAGPDVEGGAPRAAQDAEGEELQERLRRSGTTGIRDDSAGDDSWPRGRTLTSEPGEAEDMPLLAAAAAVPTPTTLSLPLAPRPKGGVEDVPLLGMTGQVSSSSDQHAPVDVVSNQSQPSSYSTGHEAHMPQHLQPQQARSMGGVQTQDVLLQDGYQEASMLLVDDGELDEEVHLLQDGTTTTTTTTTDSTAHARQTLDTHLPLADSISTQQHETTVLGGSCEPSTGMVSLSTAVVAGKRNAIHAIKDGTLGLSDASSTAGSTAALHTESSGIVEVAVQQDNGSFSDVGVRQLQQQHPSQTVGSRQGNRQGPPPEYHTVVLHPYPGVQSPPHGHASTSPSPEEGVQISPPQPAATITVMVTDETPDRPGPDTPLITPVSGPITPDRHRVGWLQLRVLNEEGDPGEGNHKNGHDGVGVLREPDTAFGRYAPQQSLSRALSWGARVLSFKRQPSVRGPHEPWHPHMTAAQMNGVGAARNEDGHLELHDGGMAWAPYVEHPGLDSPANDSTPRGGFPLHRRLLSFSTSMSRSMSRMAARSYSCLDTLGRHVSGVSQKLMQKDSVQKTVRVGTVVLREASSPPIMSCLLAIIIGCVPALKNQLFPQGAPLRLVIEVLQTLSQCCVPTLMLVLGSTLAYGPGQTSVSLHTLVSVTVCRLVILPIIGLMVVLSALSFGWFKPTDPIFLMVLLSAQIVPTAINVQTMASVHQNGDKEVAAMLFWQYLACIITFPPYLTFILYIVSKHNFT